MAYPLKNIQTSIKSYLDVRSKLTINGMYNVQVKVLKSKLKKRLVGLAHVKFVLPFDTS